MVIQAHWRGARARSAAALQRERAMCFALFCRFATSKGGAGGGGGSRQMSTRGLRVQDAARLLHIAFADGSDEHYSHLDAYELWNLCRLSHEQRMDFDTFMAGLAHFQQRT